VLFVLSSIEVYSGLDTCVIEGIEAIALKFHNIFLSMKKKQYDVLDHRKQEFDRDFEDFKHYISDLEVRHAIDMNSWLLIVDLLIHNVRSVFHDQLEDSTLLRICA